MLRNRSDCRLIGKAPEQEQTAQRGRAANAVWKNFLHVCGTRNDLFCRQQPVKYGQAALAQVQFAGKGFKLILGRINAGDVIGKELAAMFDQGQTERAFSLPGSAGKDETVVSPCQSGGVEQVMLRQQSGQGIEQGCLGKRKQVFVVFRGMVGLGIVKRIGTGDRLLPTVGEQDQFFRVGLPVPAAKDKALSGFQDTALIAAGTEGTAPRRAVQLGLN